VINVGDKHLRNIKAIVAYDGTDFSGWQIQTNHRTVQKEIQNALRKIHEREITVTASGRTDSGVHAKGQVINFFSDKDKINDEKFRDAINYFLPQDVTILKCTTVPDSFNARRSAKKRVYQYYIYTSAYPFPHYRKYCYFKRRQPDIRKLNELSHVIIGEHDFSVFAASGDTNKSKVRYVSSSHFYINGPFLIYRIEANGFLYRMVRSILGTILELEQQNRQGEDLKKILTSGSRDNAGQTVPARGLFLEKVYYQDNE
jgi:tRNA pseudouridine38-40 synthase